MSALRLPSSRRGEGDRRIRWGAIATPSPSGAKRLYLPLQWQMQGCASALMGIAHSRRHGEANYVSHLEAKAQYDHDFLVGVRPPRRPPIKIDPETKAILIKCDDPLCGNYVQGHMLKNRKVMLSINDPEAKGGRSVVQVTRSLCPHCFVLSSKSGTQDFSPTPERMERSKSAVNPWREPDRRPASEVDPVTYEEMRKRYKP